MRTFIECRNVSKRYGQGEFAEHVVKEVSLSVDSGEACCLVGPSGSGKTTLLSIIGCLLSPTAGEVRLGGAGVDFTSSESLSEIRRTGIGYVFQHAQLLPFLTVEENLVVVGRNAAMADGTLRARMNELLERLGIAGMRGKKPEQLSGGQRQRVAIARALMHSPPVILADEPTAALDWHSAQTVVRLLAEQIRQENAALVMVTHDTRLLDNFDCVLRMEEGRLQE